MLFAHIPHTSGRLIRKFIDKDDYFHNSTGIQNLKCINYPIYFVLRDPIERMISEFVHYSNNLINMGMVNHLTSREILSQFPDFNLSDPYDYFSLEVNRNVMCKFLLLKKNFNETINELEFIELKNKIEKGEIVYDIFNNETINYTVLKNLIKIEDLNELKDKYYRKNIKQVELKNKLLENEDLRTFLEKENKYDCELHRYLRFS